MRPKSGTGAKKVGKILMGGENAGPITRAVNDIAFRLQGAPEDVVDLVYNELRILARNELRYERRGGTLHTTALVNEAFVRLMGGSLQSWENRAHFYGSAALAMRRLLVEEARRRARHGTESDVCPLQIAVEPADLADTIDLLVLDDALYELARIDPHLAGIVNLRYFAGLSVEDTALALQISERTVKRDWAMARAWLFRRMSKEGPGTE